MVGWTKPFLLAVLLGFGNLAIADSGILPSWMRRFSGPSDGPANEKIIIKEVVKEVVINQLPPEISNLKIELKNGGPEAVISGEVKANSAIHVITIDGQEIPHKAGVFKLNRQLMPGANEFTFVAVDSRGLETKLKVSQQFSPADRAINASMTLNPQKLPRPVEYEDAVALIIGISKYQENSPSKFSDRDAELFKVYAGTALRVPERRIKTLYNEDATRINILKSIDLWLKSEVSANTRVYLFYSGHGLATPDGEVAYLIPYDGDATYLSDTSISLKLLFQRIEALKPREVVAFIDSCYSGQTRVGGTLLADARPIAIQVTGNKFGGEKSNIFTAASGIELAGSDERLRHGLFSFHLMKGLEGGADLNGDGAIDSSELNEYIRRAVLKDSALSGRPQSPEYKGKPIRIR